MPKVKPPPSLQAMSMDALVAFVVRFYDQLGATDCSSEKFHGRISLIKAAVCNRIPWHYLAEFCTRFLEELFRKDRTDEQNKAALEIVMDSEIVGLRCGGEMLHYLDPKDGHRFQRPVELDFTYFFDNAYHTRYTGLANHHLNYLTIFIFPEYCIDSDLTLIGNNCLKLEVLKVQRSNSITDKGLRALSRCSELRVIHIHTCDGVSHSGVNHLLSVHTKLQEFSFGGLKDFDKSRLSQPNDILSRLDLAALCPSMKSFRIHDAAITDEHLRSIVAKFPNLASFGMKDSIVKNLVILAPLDKLEAIELHFVSVNSRILDNRSSDIEQTWQRLQELVSLIGNDITTLKFCCRDQGFFWYQEGLNFIFQSCPNIERLEFDHGSGTMVIPQFQKLKVLIPHVPINFVSSDLIGPPKIEFKKLLNLESLTLIDFGVTFERVKLIMLDDVNFPQLTKLYTDRLTYDEFREIERIARCHNIDFEIRNSGIRSWYSERMYPM